MLEQASQEGSGVAMPGGVKVNIDVVLQDMVYDCWVMVGLDELKSLFQP